MYTFGKFGHIFYLIVYIMLVIFELYSQSFRVYFYRIASRKVWLIEDLVNLVNRLRFTKLRLSKLVVTINNPLADLFIRQTFLAKLLKRINSPFSQPKFLL